MKALARDTILQSYKASNLYKSVGRVEAAISDDDRVNFVNTLLHPTYNRRFILGSGRTGNVMKSFAMRLMHLDIGQTYVIGETVTPSMEGKRDLVIAGSGSGVTAEVVNPVKVARDLGVAVIGITSNKSSPLVKYSSCIVKYSSCIVYIPVNDVISGKRKSQKQNKREHGYVEGQMKGVFNRSILVSTLFENALGIFLDKSVGVCMDLLGKTDEELRARHENLQKPS